MRRPLFVVDLEQPMLRLSARNQIPRFGKPTGSACHSHDEIFAEIQISVLRRCPVRDQRLKHDVVNTNQSFAGQFRCGSQFNRLNQSGPEFGLRKCRHSAPWLNVGHFGCHRGFVAFALGFLPLDGVVNLAAVNADFTRGFNAEAHFVAANLNDHD